MTESAVPPDFKLFVKDSSFNDVLYPLYIRLENGRSTIGLRVAEHHCNFMKICHGGAIMTLLDIALSDAVSCALGKYTATPTISINLDFMAAAKLGDWIYVDTDPVDLTRTMGFVGARVAGPRGNIARGSGCFKLPTDLEQAPGMDVDEYHAWRTQT